MSPSLRALVGLAIAITVRVQAQHPVVQALVDGVDIDSLVWDLERLSGQEPVDVGAGDQLILSRHKSNPGNALAADWLQQRLAAYGYTPVVQAFGATGENILAMKPGAVHPERKVVVCGHYDAMPGGPVNAPAADDDGSGSCAVLEAARLMAPHTFENTIVFALWDEEEQGLVGSHYYAGAAAASDEPIVGAVNMDAIAYDGNGDGLLRIHTKNTGNSLAIKDTALLVNSTYGLDLNIAINNPGATYSDHASFWTEGYGAILLIEDFDNDGNPHYHTSTDLLEHLDLAYWRSLTRLGVGTTAALAIPYDNVTAVAHPAQSRSEELEVHPNPVTGTSQVRCTLDSTATVRLSVVDAVGREVLLLHEGLLARGRQAFDLDARGLVPGAYVVRWASGDMLRTVRIVRTP